MATALAKASVVTLISVSPPLPLQAMATALSNHRTLRKVGLAGNGLSGRVLAVLAPALYKGGLAGPCCLDEKLFQLDGWFVGWFWLSAFTGCDLPPALRMSPAAAHK